MGEDVTAEHRALFTSLMSLIRSASAIFSLDVDFIRAADREVGEELDVQSARILTLVNRILGASTGESPNFKSLEDLLRRWNIVEQCFDSLADKFEVALKEPSALVGQNVPKPPTSQPQNKANNIPRPQDSFSVPPNNSHGPFRPLLTQKPHALVNLAESLKQRPPDSDHADLWYSHPYETEINEQPLPKRARRWREPIPPSDWNSTPFTFVDKPAQLTKLVKKLRNAGEIAIDLEHHEYRSYLGLVCLMQISTRTEDWVIDTLALRTELQVLNEVFCDPHTIKVFHGAFMDILWLQRDLGLYVVNLFDTGVASRLLGKAKHSLAYLLQSYCNFTASKQYQLSDWRVRPLPSELLAYARADTHFLLFIYDNLRNELLREGKLDKAFAESREVSLKRYEKPLHNENPEEPSWLGIAFKYHIPHSQRGLLKALYEWRDNEAREADESPRFIMSPQVLAALCSVQPETASGVVNVTHHVSPYLRNHAVSVANLISEYKSQPEAPATSLSQQDLFSPEALDAASKLRLQTPVLYSDPQQSKIATPLLILPIVSPSDLEKIVEFSRKIQSNSVSNVEQEHEVESAEDENTPPKREDLETSGHHERRKGKRVNVVDTTDDLEAGIGTPPKKKSRQLHDEPAFDFASVKPKRPEVQQADSVKIGAKATGPRAARAPRRGNPRSRTFHK